MKKISLRPVSIYIIQYLLMCHDLTMFLNVINGLQDLRFSPIWFHNLIPIIEQQFHLNLVFGYLTMKLKTLPGNIYPVHLILKETLQVIWEAVIAGFKH